MFFKYVEDGLKKINLILTKEQKIYGVLVLILSMAGALLETLGVGIIIPFVQLILDYEALVNNNIVKVIIGKLTFINATNLIIYMTFALIIIFIIKNLFFMFLSWVRARYSCKIERELSVGMLRACLNKGYMYFVNEGDAEIMKYINSDTAGVSQLVFQCLRVITDVCIIAFVGIFIVIADYMIAIGIVIMAGISIAIVYGYFRNRMRKAGEEYNYYCGKSSQYLMQAVMGVKEVLATKKENFFVDKFEEMVINKQNKYVQQNIGWDWPTYIIEGLAITFLMGTVCIRIMMSDGDIVAMIPLLSSFAIGAFRILPSLGRISTAINLAVYYTPALEHVYQHLKNSKENETYIDVKENVKVEFNDRIQLKNIDWKYTEENGYVLKDLCLEIKKGQSVGIVGTSGSGKTTLVDIMLGLLKPESGNIFIDNVDVHVSNVNLSQILSYVPQNSFLINDTLRHNIAFGVDNNEIEDKKIWSALEKAQLKDFVQTLPHGIDTELGDNGVKFSGGQKQRVAIARALYNSPEIIIFDEATAALDNDTELAVMEAIDALHGEKTLIIIAHRLTTIKNCDVIYEVKDGKVVKRTYDELTSDKE